jgi:tetratricopeptide (TPR) repeat protein
MQTVETRPGSDHPALPGRPAPGPFTRRLQRLAGGLRAAVRAVARLGDTPRTRSLLLCLRQRMPGERVLRAAALATGLLVGGWLGICTVHLWMLDREMATINRIIEHEPDPWNFCARGRAHHERGQYREALADFSTAIRLKPTMAYPYLARGLVHAEPGDHQAAIADYTEAIRLVPTYKQPYNARGVSYQQLGRLRQADDDYATALTYDRTFALALFNRGTISEAMGQDGEEFFQEAYRLDPVLATYRRRPLANYALTRTYFDGPGSPAPWNAWNVRLTREGATRDEADWARFEKAMREERARLAQGRK